MPSSPASLPAPPSPDEAPSDSPIVETSVAETSPESSSSSDAPTSSDPEDVGSALSSDPDPEGGGAASATEPDAASASEPEAAQPKAVSPLSSEPRDTDSDYLGDSASSDSSTSPNSSTSPKKANLGDADTEVLRDEFELPGRRSAHQGALLPAQHHHLWYLSILEKPGGLVQPSVLLG